MVRLLKYILLGCSKVMILHDEIQESVHHDNKRVDEGREEESDSNAEGRETEYKKGDTLSSLSLCSPHGVRLIISTMASLIPLLLLCKPIKWEIEH